jgi:hypothetical protein
VVWALPNLSDTHLGSVASECEVDILARENAQRNAADRACEAGEPMPAWLRGASEGEEGTS